MERLRNDNLRKLFGAAHKVSRDALKALGPSEKDPADEGTALKEATRRLQQIVAEIVAVQDSEVS